jgi:3-oxoacyl-[acyl-carrier-protein] synthase II
MTRRVVVTGVGLVTPIGTGSSEVFDTFLQGKNGIGTITNFDPEGYSSQIAGEVSGFDENDFFTPKDSRKMDRFIRFGVAASLLALEDSKLVIDSSNATRVGVSVGSGIGGLGYIEKQYDILKSKGPKRVSPFFIPSVIINLASGAISIRTGAKGPNHALVTACATGTHSIGDSYKMIQRGDADAMFAGGAEAAVTPLAVAGFASLRALSTRNDKPEAASRPFDKERDGFVIGEGAAVLILEEREHALKRGAKIYCEVVGYGLTGDAYHITAPAEDGDGPARAMEMAIKDAGVDPSSLAYINAHGTSTPYNDKIETGAIKRVFKDHAYKLKINSTKSMTGHLLGGAGGLEGAVTALSIYNQKVHPTINLTVEDPDCDLDYVSRGAEDLAIEYAMSNSFGFGGTNACILMKKHEE